MSTDADRERAMRALGWEYALDPESRERVAIIAAALAEERATARAPFLRLAAEFDMEHRPSVAYRVRLAAKETQ